MKKRYERPGTMQKYVYYAVAIGIALVVWMLQSPPRKGTPQPPTEPIAEPLPTEKPDGVTAEEPAAPAAKPVDAIDAEAPPAETKHSKAPPAKSHSVIQTLPKIDQVRDEVKRDPHSPPPSGVKFAMNLVGRMEKAEGSREEAEKLFAELSECATNRDASVGVPSMKALCIQSARDLTKKYPELQARFDEMKKNADPRAASIADQVP